MSQPKKVSVIIPVYNTGNYLQASLDSIFGQTLEDIEIICINDGTTDHSGEILERNRKRITKIITKKNGGLSSARNAGLQEAGGEYIYFFDSDDLLESFALEELYKDAKADNLDLLHFEYCRFFDSPADKDAFHGETDIPIHGLYNSIYNGNELFSQKIKNDDFQSSVCIRFIRKRLLDRLQLTFYDGIIHEDELFSVICDVQAERVRHISRKYFKRRVRGNSIMTKSDNQELHVLGRLIVIASLAQYFSKCNKEMADDIAAAVQTRINNVSEAAFYGYEHLSSAEKKRLQTQFHADVQVICSLFTHIYDYAFASGGHSQTKMESLLKETQNKLQTLEEAVNRPHFCSEPLKNAEKEPSEAEFAIQLFPEKTALSVVIPVYNMRHFLPECLDSVTSQTLRNIEIICVNDGSTDDSGEILRAYAKKDSRIHVIEQHNQGVAAARNRGLRETTGEFIAFLDPDDYYPQDSTLEKLYTAARLNNVPICGGSAVFLENGEFKKAVDAGFPQMAFVSTGKMLYSDYQGDYGFWRFIYSRRFLEAHHLSFPPYRRFQDPPFMVEAFAKAKNFYAMEEPVYIYRANYKKPRIHSAYVPHYLDVFSGLRDVLALSRHYGLARLHQTVFERINTELIDFSDPAVYDGNEAIFLKLLELQRNVDPSLLLPGISPLILPLQRMQRSSEAYNRIAFSVIVPIYNTEPYLPRCIESLRNQTWCRFEVIFVDDASPGDCREIIEGYNDTRFHYVRHEKNRGLLAARLTGAAQAKGEYILQLDSDDTLEPWLLKALWDAIIQTPNTDIIIYKTNLILNGIKSAFWANLDPCEMNSEEIFRALLQKNLYWSTCGKCFRRETYIKGIGALNLPEDLILNSWEDLLIFYPIAYFAKKLTAIDCFGYNYIKNDQSISGQVFVWERWVRAFSDMHRVWSTISDFSVQQEVPASDMNCIRELQWSAVVWGLREIQSLPSQEWQKRVAFLENCCYPELLFARLFEEYRLRLADLDFSSVIFPVRPDKMIKTIAILCDTMSSGGAERATALLIRHLMEMGYLVVLFNNQEPQNTDYDYPSVPRYTLPVANLVLRWRMLQQKCDEHKVDAAIVVDHIKTIALIDLVCLKHCGIKVVMQEHNSYFFPLINSAFMHQFLFRKPFYQLADSITCLSDTNEKWWHAAGYPQAEYVPNFLTFSPEQAILSPLESNDLVFIGRMTEKKGIFDALNVIVRLKKNLPCVRLHMLGRFVSPAEETHFKDMIRANQLEENICYEGHVSDVSPFLQIASALIMCSAVEGAPMVLFEAKAYGVPTVLFDMPYVAGISREEGALTVPQGDAAAMSEVLARLLAEDRSELEELGRAAAASLDDYTDSAVRKKWQRILAHLENPTVQTAVPVDPFLRTTLQEFDFAVATMYHRVEEGMRNIGHAQYLSSELTKMTDHAQHLSSELTKMTGHAQYLSAKLAKFETNLILRILLRIRNLLSRIKNKPEK